MTEINTNDVTTNTKIPVIEFSKYDSTTMTVTVPLNTTAQNLHAIFILLPTTKYTIPEGTKLQCKGGKIVYPKYWKSPTGEITTIPRGEIISARYGQETKGILRSKTNAFPTSITFDISTSLRPVSLKFSQTIKLTGPPNFRIVDEAVTDILYKIKDLQEKVTFLKNNFDEIFHVINTFKDVANHNETQKLIRNIICNFGFEDDLNYFAELTDKFIRNFDGILYDGLLTHDKYHSEMINISFELGFIVHQKNMVKMFDNTIFIPYHNTARNNSTVRITYNTLKKNRKGEIVPGTHTFKINKSGNVTFSGPNLEDMEKVYYSFYKILLSDPGKAKTMEPYVKKLKIKGEGRAYSVKEWFAILEEEEELRNKILKGDVPLCSTDINTDIPGFEYMETDEDDEDISDDEDSISVVNVYKVNF